ncbi:DUF4260 family protein [Enterovibrio calviensis]|uniref:DUF4260 family protein n=1 Tax=Enterovibrio calviensis TaxID=91359 RepID=UPI0037351F0C
MWQFSTKHQDLRQCHVLCASPIWFAYIGFDRTLGDGLKDSDAFSSSHLGHICKPTKHSES